MQRIVLFLISVGVSVAMAEAKRGPAAAPNFTITKVNKTQFKKAERWFDRQNNFVCYTVTPGGSYAFRMNCLNLPPGAPAELKLVEAKRIRYDKDGTEYLNSETWFDQDLNVICAVISPGDNASVDLGCTIVR